MAQNDNTRYGEINRVVLVRKLLSAVKADFNSNSIAEKGGIIFLAVLFAFFMFLLIYGGKKATQSRQWQPIKGRIISSEISERRTESEQGSKFIRSAKVVYQYSVNNKKYTSTRISFWKKTYAEISIKRYPAGKRVVVYYDPKNPKVSVLDKGLSIGFYVLAFIMLFFTSLLVISLVIYINKKYEYVIIMNNAENHHARQTESEIDCKNEY